MRTWQRKNRLKHADFRPGKTVMMCKRLKVEKLLKHYESLNIHRKKGQKIHNFYLKQLLKF